MRKKFHTHFKVLEIFSCERNYWNIGCFHLGSTPCNSFSLNLMDLKQLNNNNTIAAETSKDILWLIFNDNENGRVVLAISSALLVYVEAT